MEKVRGMLNNFSHVKFSVIDSGIGIKEEDKGKLFKLFGMLDESKNKTKVNTNGIGLGLVISQLIIKKFDGIIDFKSTYG